MSTNVHECEVAEIHAANVRHQFSRMRPDVTFATLRGTVQVADLDDAEVLIFGAADRDVWASAAEVTKRIVGRAAWDSYRGRTTNVDTTVGRFDAAGRWRRRFARSVTVSTPGSSSLRH